MITNTNSVSLEEWLVAHDLESLLDRFLDNGVDIDVIPDLKEHHLRELGLSLGQRVRLLKIIENLTNDEIEISKPLLVERSSNHLPERRQLTVMFVDLVGSTELAIALDPEILRDLMLDYQDRVAGQVARHRGHVARYMGDGVLCYFGWPQAQEDSVENAVRAALAVVDIVSQLTISTGQSMRTRIGIATGLVVVGDLVGEGSSREETVIGETPSLAARLQALAKPDQVLISKKTMQLVAQSFHFEDLGHRILKGFPNEIRVYSVVESRVAVTRFGKRDKGDNALVGRDKSLLRLQCDWSRTCSGFGQVLLLVGEAGIGKSGLINRFSVTNSLSAEELWVWQCSPNHTDSVLFPVIQQLTHLIGQSSVNSAGSGASELVSASLEKLLHCVPDVRPSDVDLFAEWLDIRAEGMVQNENYSSEEKRDRILFLICELIISFNRSTGLMLLVEDIHWADFTTLELLNRISTRLERASVYMLLTIRPEALNRCESILQVAEVLELERLQTEEIAELVGLLSGGKSVPFEILQLIIDRSDGVPLFVEEMTKSVLESGQLFEEDSAYELAGPLQDLHVPASLHDSLMARLDRLQMDKNVVQTAACIGREFDLSLLCAVQGQSKHTVLVSLQLLMDTDLVFRNPDVEDGFLFKHALVRDAVYESLLKSTRMSRHAEIAHNLDGHQQQGVHLSSELIGYHQSCAGNSEAAIASFRIAAENAFLKSANEESIGILERAMDELENIPSEETRDYLERELLNAIHLPMVASRGFIDPQQIKYNQRAETLARQTGSETELLGILLARQGQMINLGDFQGSLDYSIKARDLAIRLGVRHAHVQALTVTAHSQLILGQLTDAKASCENALSLYWSDPGLKPNQYVPFDFGVYSQGLHAVILFILGYPDQACQSSMQAIEYANTLNDDTSMGFGLYFAGMVFTRLAKDYPLTEKYCVQLSCLAESGKVGMWAHSAFITKNWLAGLGGNHETSLAAMQGSSEHAGSIIFRRWELSQIAEVMTCAGNPSGAIRILDEALTEADDTGEKWYTPELLRLKGDALLKRGDFGDIDKAEDAFKNGLVQAKELQSKSWELRCAMSLAKIRESHDKTAQYEEILDSIFQWFNEGFETTDLKESRILLKA